MAEAPGWLHVAVQEIAHADRSVKRGDRLAGQIRAFGDEFGEFGRSWVARSQSFTRGQINFLCIRPRLVESIVRLS